MFIAGSLPLTLSFSLSLFLSSLSLFLSPFLRWIRVSLESCAAEFRAAFFSTRLERKRIFCYKVKEIQIKETFAGRIELPSGKRAKIYDDALRPWCAAS